MTLRWVTVEKASEETGLPCSFFHERTGLSGEWPERTVWKWFEGRKMIDLQELYNFIDKRPSIQSKRGRRKTPQCQGLQSNLLPA
jgi:hypothetical protein